jgi:hypothetical protein
MKGDIEGWIEKDGDDLLKIVVNAMKSSMQEIAYTKANLIRARDAKSKLLGKEMLVNAFLEKERTTKR